MSGHAPVQLSARLHPGEPLGDRVLKVNHAGEHGAVNIYRAQLFLARWTAPAMVAELREFKSHEERHRRVFGAELERRSVRRCRSYLLCGAGGWVLGLVSGLCGAGAIAATTVAIERVVLAHMSSQVWRLQVEDELAVAAIRSVIDEERAHHDRSISRGAGAGFWAAVLGPVVSGSTELVIWAGMHL